MDHSFCQWVIGGMATAIVGMAGFIALLVRSERAAAQKRELRMQKEHEDVLRATLDEIVKRRENP